MTEGQAGTGGADKPRRMQFEFSPEAYHRLERLKRDTEARSYAELVRNALRVYDWMVHKQAEGYNIALSKEGEPVKEVEFVFD